MTDDPPPPALLADGLDGLERRSVGHTTINASHHAKLHGFSGQSARSFGFDLGDQGLGVLLSVRRPARIDRHQRADGRSRMF